MHFRRFHECHQPVHCHLLAQAARQSIFQAPQQINYQRNLICLQARLHCQVKSVNIIVITNIGRKIQILGFFSYWSQSPHPITDSLMPFCWLSNYKPWKSISADESWLSEVFCCVTNVTETLFMTNLRDRSLHYFLHLTISLKWFLLFFWRLGRRKKVHFVEQGKNIFKRKARKTLFISKVRNTAALFIYHVIST